MGAEKVAISFVDCLEVFPVADGHAIPPEVDLVRVYPAAPDLIDDRAHRAFGYDGAVDGRLQFPE